jgi:histidinol phosphatase-like PHP family hydrolase
VADLARRAREAGATYVVVHGESPVEPVAPGTNEAAAKCGDVDILAHPGLLTVEAAAAAAAHGVYIEVTARKGHSLSNGHVVATVRETQAKMVLDSDAHSPEDLLTEDFARTVAAGAGLTSGEATLVLRTYPEELLQRMERAYQERWGGS